MVVNTWAIPKVIIIMMVTKTCVEARDSSTEDEEVIVEVVETSLKEIIQIEMVTNITTSITTGSTTMVK
jgi:hypothetical protein